MDRCPSCSRPAPAGGRFCPACGAPLAPGATSAPTPTPEDATPAAPPGEPTPSTGMSAMADDARFVPGTVLAGRYRIVGLLGRGGMGEVYRADDLKLGESVALKFLPRGLDSDPERLRRFLGEVKVALKITHPNVCRVYDVGEVDGAHFLSMEYVDGEDLSSLVRRIGRLPEDKAVQIARQLCAGLAAAHDKGILHRDLKPANVMLDGRGDVRITDFGLAGLAEGFTGIEIRAGTPAFMAPEQLAGKEVTVKSDIYSLGLVLYELFTGKRAFSGSTAAELTASQLSGPSRPSSHVQLLDPAVEGVILRCLAAEPADRPPSVIQVALALPGGDPLAAALAAGETPSPEMVAEAGDDSTLGPRIAVPILVLTLLGLLASSYLAGRYHLLGRVQMELPPEVLVHRAREIIEELGYADSPADHAYRFASDSDLIRHLSRDPSPDRWERLAAERPTAISLWYRQSPRALVPRNPGSRVLFNDPPVRISGMVNVFLDSAGRLSFFEAVPPQLDESPAPADAAPSWAAAFVAAGLDPVAFAPTSPHWLPEAFCDQRSAWLGAYPDQPGLEIRVEACAYEGRPVYFSLVHPWDRAFRQQEAEQTDTEELQRVVAGILSLAILIGAALLVRRNLRLGRGDREGAWRLAVWVTAMAMGGWLFQASHQPEPQQEINLFAVSMGIALFSGGLVWVLYIALEPFLRRRWPESLVSWNRLLAGRFRDPLVGRHLLYGAALGVGTQLVDQLGILAPTFFGDAALTPPGVDLDTLMGTRWVLGEVFLSLGQVATQPLVLFFLLVLLRVVLRNSWLALAAFAAIFFFLNLPDSEYALIYGAAQGLIFGTIGFFMMRFGLVAVMSAYFVSSELLSSQPMTLDFSTWYAGSTLTALVVGVALILFAFRTATGGRALLAEE